MGSLWSAVNRGKVKVTGQTIIIRAITNAQGITTVNLPYPGAWMVSLVHMVRVTGVKGVDWDSLWGNLSFVVPEKK